MSIISSLIHSQEAILFQVNDLKEYELTEGLGDNFLDAFDASFCTFEGGDDSAIDPVYPDTTPNPANESYLANGQAGDVWCLQAHKFHFCFIWTRCRYIFFYENRQC